VGSSFKNKHATERVLIPVVIKQPVVVPPQEAAGGVVKVPMQKDRVFGVGTPLVPAPLTSTKATTVSTSVLKDVPLPFLGEPTKKKVVLKKGVDGHSASGSGAGSGSGSSKKT
jgi:hypothetical protein